MIQICTLDGRTFKVPITDVIDDEYEKVITGEGMPIVGTSCKGDLIIRFKVDFPKYCPGKSKSLLKEAFMFMAESADGSSPEDINKMVLTDKMNRIPLDEQLPPAIPPCKPDFSCN